ncbi:MAG: hypothetical protein AAFY76_14295, partial [Cyanobacteria bacterium J06649_11]
QKKYFSRRKLRVVGNTISYSVVKLGDENEVSISFEDISGEKVSNESSNRFMLIGGSICVIISAILIGLRYLEQEIGNYAELFWLVIGITLLFIYNVTKEEFWKIKVKNDKYIYLYKAIPSENEVEKFLSNMMKKRDEYLLLNYGNINSNLDYDTQFKRFQWLLKMNVITDQEFKEKKSQLDQIFGSNGDLPRFSEN